MDRQQEVLARGDVDEGRRKKVLEQDTRVLVRAVEDALGALQEREELAKEQGWNFLVCAVGAEVEALARGREVLAGLLEDGKEGRQKLKADEEQVEKAQSVQDLRRERQVERDRPSSAGSGSGRAKKTSHGRQSSFPTFGWSRKASAVEPKLTRDDDAQRRGGGRDEGTEPGGDEHVGEKASGKDVAASVDGESITRRSADGEERLLEELNGGGGAGAQGDDDALLRDLMSGGQ